MWAHHLVDLTSSLHNQPLSNSFLTSLPAIPSFFFFPFLKFKFDCIMIKNIKNNDKVCFYCSSALSLSPA